MSTHNPVVILVEDETQIRRFVRSALETEHCQVHEADCAQRGLIEASTRNPSLIILDLGLPDRDGIDFIRDLRCWSKVPVLVLSARAQEVDKIDALDAGADDYLVKPFGTGELLARVRAMLRRSARANNEKSSIIEFGSIRVDIVSRSVKRDGELVHLTPIEYRLLVYLISHAEKVLTHQQLLRDVWGQAYIDNNPSLRVFMGNLRHKLEIEPAKPQHFLTEVGVGYRFVL